MYGIRTFGTKILVVILVCPYFGEFVRRGSTVDCYVLADQSRFIIHSTKMVARICITTRMRTTTCQSHYTITTEYIQTTTTLYISLSQ